LQLARPLLSPDGFIYLEADRPFDDAALEPLGLRVWRSAKAGSVHYHLLRLCPVES
jgi:16S rRNA (guanine966-N2)-methyltransferase